MSPHHVLTPEASPEPELPQFKGGLWRATPPKRKRSWLAAGVEGFSPSDSIRELWEDEWRHACQKGAYPFQDGTYEDFEPIFDDLIEDRVEDPTSPDYTLAFLPKAQGLALEAERALLDGDRALATESYLRACAVLRIARYPSTSNSACSVKQRAWQLQKSFYLKAGRLWESPLDEVVIPHIHDAKSSDQHAHRSSVRDRGSKTVKVHRPRIPLYVRLPTNTHRTGRPCPAVLIIGEDRTAHTRQCEEALSRGWGCVVAEVPGAGDCPVSLAQGEEAADKLWSSVLDWMEAIRVFDLDNLVVWGNGEAVVRIAGTHGDRVKGCVAQLDDTDERDLSMLDEVSCRLLLVTHGDSTVGTNGLWTPVLDEKDESRLALYDYGVSGTSVVQYPVADMWTVYKWVGDIVG